MFSSLLPKPKVKASIPRHINVENLKSIVPALQGIESFVFFGTLLGLVREGQLIDGDDDVDIFVHHQDRDQLIKNLQNLGFSLSFRPDCPFMEQIQVEKEGLITHIDFFIYTKHKDFSRWIINHPGIRFPYLHELRVPNELLFPLKTLEYEGVTLSTPQRPEQCCEWLYGSEWRIPIKKKVDYTFHYIGGNFVIFKGINAKIVTFLIANLNRVLKLPWKIKNGFWSNNNRN